MPSKLNPYFSFKDNAREAMEFYKGVFGGELTVSTFKDYQMSEDPKDADLIMHSQLVADNGITLMGADTPESMGPVAPNGTVALSGDDDAELRGYWGKLSQGGKIDMPLEVAPWGDAFGMLTDKYGISWSINIAGKQA